MWKLYGNASVGVSHRVLRNALMPSRCKSHRNEICSAELNGVQQTGLVTIGREQRKSKHIGGGKNTNGVLKSPGARMVGWKRGKGGGGGGERKAIGKSGSSRHLPPVKERPVCRVQHVRVAGRCLPTPEPPRGS